MLAYTSVKLKRLIEIEFIRFCMVGGTGFVINFAILTLLQKSLHVPIFFAQLVGAEIALFCNFMLHHHWTYKSHKVEKSFRKLLIQFHSTSWVAIIGSAIMVSALERYLHFSDLVSLLISSAIALLWNFVWSKYIIWRDVSNKGVKDIID